MKAEQNGTIVNLRAENRDEQRLLDAFWERGVRGKFGGSRLGITLPGGTYIIELNEEQVMALMHLLGSGREQERSFLSGVMIGKGSILDLEDEKVSLALEYQMILEEVIRSMKRRAGGATMAFPARAFTQPEPAIISEDREKET